MTRDDMHTCSPLCERPICVAVRKAVEAEREACAKCVEDEIKRIKPVYSVTAENALKAIRARGKV